MALLETHYYARSIDLSIGMNIILPEHSEAWNEPPAVLYLLHGLSGDHTSWIRSSSIERYARDYNLAVVMPNAHKSFYCDMEHGSNYWKLFSEEIPMLVNRWFNLSNEGGKTFVAGTSMGGYGAIKLALGCPDRFSHAASLSGALDIASHIHDEWNEARNTAFEATFGSLEKVPNSGNDLIHQIQTLEKIPENRFYVCCGTEDYLYEDSVSFRNTATKRGLDLTYNESSGTHDWTYWDAQIQNILSWLPIEKLVKP
ncbi:alpha/beta hydrolase family protein [Pontiellaceae bacterium B12227]|nr:alpha/beta hydrolase family protein [Pontiellaceae bacterium B12227]